MSTALAFLPRIWACEELSVVVEAVSKKKLEPVEPQLAFYRKYTEAMMRRYLRLSMEAGRVPSMLGREMFLGNVSSYRVHSFEDAVIFVHDVEKCVARLEKVQQILIKRIAVQEFTPAELATTLRMNRWTVIRRYEEAIDRLTAIFLEVKLLEPQKACQEGRSSK